MYYNVNFIRKMHGQTLMDEYKKLILNETKDASLLLIDYLKQSQNVINPFPFSLIADCFEKAYDGVYSKKTCVQVMASYRNESESIFGTIPKELIAYIFEINSKLPPHFDKFHTDLEVKGYAPEYLDTISRIDRNELGYNVD